MRLTCLMTYLVVIGVASAYFISEEMLPESIDSSIIHL